MTHSTRTKQCAPKKLDPATCCKRVSPLNGRTKIRGRSEKGCDVARRRCQQRPRPATLCPSSRLHPTARCTGAPEGGAPLPLPAGPAMAQGGAGGQPQPGTIKGTEHGRTDGTSLSSMLPQWSRPVYGGAWASPSPGVGGGGGGRGGAEGPQGRRPWTAAGFPWLGGYSGCGRGATRAAAAP